ncbi:hypothetical protein BB561_002584 [Smittium simulii]|uniref:Zinc finger PHD-type domain-containing protein n=1 Tax=Smittium simulii TaxID=133385 RepID=A0A2T9YQ12_9FUNG|nr:hypothetical protein BB561_002584 [Smittium simulii]
MILHGGSDSRDSEKFSSEGDTPNDIIPEYLIQLKLQNDIDNRSKQRKPKTKPKKPTKNSTLLDKPKHVNVFCQVCGNYADIKTSVICCECDELFHESCVNVDNSMLGPDNSFSCQTCVLQFPRRQPLKNSHKNLLWLSDTSVKSIVQNVPQIHEKMDLDELDECPICEQNCTCGFTNTNQTGSISMPLQNKTPIDLSAINGTTSNSSSFVQSNNSKMELLTSDLKKLDVFESSYAYNQKSSSDIIVQPIEKEYDISKISSSDCISNQILASNLSNESFHNSTNYLNISLDQSKFSEEHCSDIYPDSKASNTNRDISINQDCQKYELNKIDSLKTQKNVQISIDDTINHAKTPESIEFENINIDQSDLQHTDIISKGLSLSDQNFVVNDGHQTADKLNFTTNQDLNMSDTLHSKKINILGIIEKVDDSNNCKDSSNDDVLIDLDVTSFTNDTICKNVYKKVNKKIKRRGRPSRALKNTGLFNENSNKIKTKKISSNKTQSNFFQGNNTKLNLKNAINSNSFNKNDLDFEDEIVNVTDISTDDDLTYHHPTLLNNDFSPKKLKNYESVPSSLLSNSSMDSDLRIEEENYMINEKSIGSFNDSSCNEIESQFSSRNSFFIKNRKLVINNARQKKTNGGLSVNKSLSTDCLRNSESNLNTSFSNQKTTNLVDFSNHIYNDNEKYGSSDYSSNEDVFYMAIKHHDFGYEISGLSNSDSDNSFSSQKLKKFNKHKINDNSANLLIKNEGIYIGSYSDTDSVSALKNNINQGVGIEGSESYSSDSSDVVLEFREPDTSKSHKNVEINTCFDSDREDALLQMHLDQLRAVRETAFSSHTDAIIVAQTNDSFSDSTNDHLTEDYSEDENRCKNLSIGNHAYSDTLVSNNNRSTYLKHQNSNNSIYTDINLKKQEVSTFSDNFAQASDNSEIYSDLDSDSNGFFSDEDIIISCRDDVLDIVNIEELHTTHYDSSVNADVSIWDDITMDEASLALGIALSLEKDMPSSDKTVESNISSLENGHVLVTPATNDKGEQDDPIDGMVSVNVGSNIKKPLEENWVNLQVDKSSPTENGDNMLENILSEASEAYILDSEKVQSITDNNGIFIEDLHNEKDFLEIYPRDNSTLDCTTNIKSNLETPLEKYELIGLTSLNNLKTSYNTTNKEVQDVVDSLSLETHSNKVYDNDDDNNQTNFEKNRLSENMLSEILLENNSNLANLSASDVLIKDGCTKQKDWEREIENLVNTEALGAEFESRKESDELNMLDSYMFSSGGVDVDSYDNFFKNLNSINSENTNSNLLIDINAFKSTIENQVNRFDKIPINVFRQSRYLAAHKKSKQLPLDKASKSVILKSNTRILNSTTSLERVGGIRKYYDKMTPPNATLLYQQDFECKDGFLTTQNSNIPNFLRKKKARTLQNVQSSKGNSPYGLKSFQRVASRESSSYYTDIDLNFTSKSSRHTKRTNLIKHASKKKISSTAQSSFNKSIYDKWDIISKLNNNSPKQDNFLRKAKDVTNSTNSNFGESRNKDKPLDFNKKEHFIDFQPQYVFADASNKSINVQKKDYLAQNNEVNDMDIETSFSEDGSVKFDFGYKVENVLGLNFENISDDFI